MLACDVMLANISKFREQGTMSNAHAVLMVNGKIHRPEEKQSVEGVTTIAREAARRN